MHIQISIPKKTGNHVVDILSKTPQEMVENTILMICSDVIDLEDDENIESYMNFLSEADVKIMPENNFVVFPGLSPKYMHTLAEDKHIAEVYNRYKHLDPVLSTLGEDDDNITHAAGEFWKAIKADLGVSEGGEQ